MTDDRADPRLPSERAAGELLPAVLGTRDLVVLFAAVVLFVTNAAVIQGAGPAAFGWWVLGFALFLVPTAVATGQLGRMFPGEGSVYLWTHKAFGPFWGFLAGFCAWWPGVLVLVATGTLVLAFLGAAFPDVLGDLDVRVQGLIITTIIGLSGAIAVLRIRAVLGLVTVAMAAYAIVILALGGAGVAWLAGGHPAATDPFDVAAWDPAGASGINLANWGFFGLAVLALLGAEVPMNLGAEIRDRASIGRYLVYGSAAVMVAYLVATFGVMVVLPPEAGAVEVTAVASAIGVVLGTGWNALAAVVFAAAFFAITVVYNLTFSRLLFVFGLDGRAPAALGRVGASRTPATAVWSQSAAAGAFALLAFVVLPTVGFGGGTAVDVQTRVYEVLQAAVTVVWCVSIVILFVDLVRVVRRHGQRFRDTRVAHRWVLDASAVVGIAAALVGVVATLSGSWTPLIPNDAGAIELFGATFSFGAWTLWVGGVAILSLLVGAGWYVIGRGHTA